MKFDCTGGKLPTLTVQVCMYNRIDQYTYADDIKAFNFFETVKRNYSLFDGFISVLIINEIFQEVVDSWMP